jgi:hypothetical protein
LGKVRDFDLGLAGGAFPFEQRGDEFVRRAGEDVQLGGHGGEVQKRNT